MFLKNKSAFTLVEITIVIALFSIIVIYVFSTMMGIGILRSHVMSKMELEENLHFFVEQLATTIKE
jgi:prepilin-type N-terminal cleavage/methylation domain-containing protein